MKWLEPLFLFTVNVLWVTPPSQSVPNDFPKTWNIPKVTENFVGRNRILKNMNFYFSSSSNGLLVLTGISGIGKSEIAKYYINQEYSNYDIVWWFNAQGDFEAQFYEFALAWNQDTNALERVPLNKIALSAIPSYLLNKLRTTQLSWFLIYDNVTDLGSISMYFPVTHYNDRTRKHILVTSKNHNGWKNKIDVPPFSKKEARDYLEKLLYNATEREFSELIDRLTLHPFYLVKTGEYIHSNHIPVELFIKSAAAQSIKTGNAVLKQNLETVAKEHPSAYSLLEFISIFDGARIPHEFLDTFFHTKNKNEDIFSSLAELNKYSLLDHKLVGNPSQKYYEIHDIILKLVHSCMKSTTRQQHLLEATKIMNQSLDMRWDKLAFYALSHPEEIARASSLWNKALDLDMQNPEIFKLGKKLLENHIYHTRNHRQYEKIYVNLTAMLDKIGTHAIDKKTLSEFQLDSIYIRSTYRSTKKLKSMGEGFLKALHYFQALNDTEEILRAYYCLAQFYLFQGMLEKAKDYMNAAQVHFKKSASLTNKSLYLYVKSWIHLEAGEFDKTNKALQTLLTLQKKTPNYSMLLYALSMNCSSLFEQKKYDEALERGQKTIRKANEFYQTEINEINAEISAVLANIFLIKKKFAEAKEYILSSIKIYADYFGTDGVHADQAYSHKTAGFIHEKLREYEEAINEYMKAVSIYEMLYKDSTDNINYLSDLYEKIALLGVTIGKERLTQKYLTLHIERFGFNHPRTKKIFKVLDTKGLSHLFS